MILAPAELVTLTDRVRPSAQRRVPLTERDEWLRHYLRQSMKMADIDRAMLFSGRRPSAVVQDLMRKNAPIQRDRVAWRGSQPTYRYPIKSLVAVVRAWGLEVTQNAPRHWVPEEVEAHVESERAETIRRLTEELREARADYASLKSASDNAAFSFALEMKRREHEVAERVRMECFERTINPDDIQNILALMMTAHELRPFPGVYWLLDAAGVVVYVGQSRNCASRMSGHRDKAFVAARMIRIEDDRHRSEIERALIRAMRPNLNVQMVPGRRAETV